MSAKPAAALRLVLELLAYNLVLLPLLPIIAGWVAWRTLVLRKPIGRWSHRLGFVPSLPRRSGPRIWLHAVSAGEMTAARPVLAELRRQFPEAAIALSTHTNTGMEMAERNCPEADAIFYFPFDYWTAMTVAMLRVRPDLVVIVEKELWPNFLATARLFGAQVLAVNGRVSDRMVRRARILPAAVRRLYRLVDVICVQSEEDARRLAQLGLAGFPPRVVLAGNTKADTLAARDMATEEALRGALAISESELWLVAGSTHPGEGEQVVDAFVDAREQEPSAHLLLAPRHLERLPDVSAKLAERGIQVVRRSEGRQAPSDAVVVLDTMGELRAAYAVAAVAFVGGTLVPVGGHNLLEPPAAGVPVLFGPHTENCADTADLLLNAGVGFRVADSAGLAAEFLRLARNAQLRRSIAQQAERLVAQQRGASARCVAAAADLLAGGVER
jgi:3-deoxy-D-manno-octulosonic-acid transferase